MSAQAKPLADIFQRENSVSDFIPYQNLCDLNTVKTVNDEYLQVIKLQGVAHETQNSEQIEQWKEQMNLLLRNIASPNICLWSHVIRREHKVFPEGTFSCEFDRKLNEKYAKKICQSQLMVNELYITVIYSAGISQKLTWLKKSRTQEQLIAQHIKATNALDEVVHTVMASLEHYQPERLTTFFKNQHFYSDVLTFLDYLVNGEWQPRIYPKENINTALPRVRPLFGPDTFALKGINQTRFGACLGIKEYPENTEAGLLNALLSAPFTFILSQSFQFFSKPLATQLLLKQQNRLDTTGDLAHSQVQAISVGLDDLTSNRIVYGEHHVVLTVLSDSIEKLNQHLANVKSELADNAIIPVREDWGLAAAFWSQLPANSKYRPRPAPISSRNFAGFCSLHNYPSGQLDGNQWGAAVTLFKTASGSPFYFNFHEPKQITLKAHQQSNSPKVLCNDLTKDAPLNDEHHALGNTLIIGASGSGKTVLQGFLISQSKKYDPTQIVFDKDRGLEIYVRACAGLYLPLRMGKPTGFNPFQLEPTPENKLFLTALITKLCGGELKHNQQQELATAVNGVMSLDRPFRRLSRCLEFLDPVEDDGCHARLRKWCDGGEFAWVLDNKIDQLDISNQKLIAFDVTEFLDCEEVRTPIIMYLFHRIEMLIDGRRLQIIMDEFWKLLADEFFEDLAQNKQKVIRKQNGIMVYATQSAKDVLNSPIAHTLIEQCATFILMPNPKAKKEDYIDGLSLTEREFDIIKTELQPSSRQFIVKQGHESVITGLNLSGFDDELAVISGTTDKVKLVHDLVDEVGSAPADWLPLYYDALADKRGVK